MSDATNVLARFCLVFFTESDGVRLSVGIDSFFNTKTSKRQQTRLGYILQEAKNCCLVSPLPSVGVLKEYSIGHHT